MTTTKRKRYDFRGTRFKWGRWKDAKACKKTYATDVEQVIRENHRKLRGRNNAKVPNNRVVVIRDVPRVSGAITQTIRPNDDDGAYNRGRALFRL